MDVTSVSNSGQALPVAPDTTGPAGPKWLAENRDLIRSVQGIDASELFGDGRELTFAMDPDTKRPVVRVVDQQTQEVVWQSPPEYLLRMAALGK
jgi:hypothetical protein